MTKVQWIFLRGLAREAGHWGDFPRAFEKSFPGAEVLCLDLPGSGSHHNLISPLSVSGMVAFAREEFLQRRKAGPTFLFSISLGSMVAVEWMTRYPQDFKGAVLINTSFKGWSPFYRRLLPKAYLHLAKIMLNHDPLAREIEILKMVSNRSELYPTVAQAWSQLFVKNPMTLLNVIRQLFAAAIYNPPKQKPLIPLLVLSSSKDQMVNPSCSDIVAKNWDSPLVRHPSAGHELVVDAPDWTLSAIRVWLQEHGPSFI